MASDRISKASSKPSNIASFEIWPRHCLWCRFGCCKFYGSSEIDGLCNICRNYELPWGLPDTPEPYIKQTNNLLTKTYCHILKSFCNFHGPLWPLTDEGLWDILIKDIPKEATLHTFSMDILKQGVSYDFRVIGVNDYGYGSPSLPSPSISGELLWVCWKKLKRINFQTKLNSPRSFRHHRNMARWLQQQQIPILTFFFFFLFFPFSSKSGTFLRGVVVPGGCGSGGAHLHPAAGFHPHYQGTEQKVCQEVRIRWVHTISQLNGAFNSYRSVVPFLLPSGTEGQESDDLTFSSTFMRGGLDDLQFSNTEQWTWANFFFLCERGYVLILNETDNWLSSRGTKKKGRGGRGSWGHTCPFSAALTSAGISLSSALLQRLFSCQAGEGRGVPAGHCPSLWLTGKTRGAFSLQHKDTLKASISPSRNLAQAAGPTQWPFCFCVFA